MGKGTAGTGKWEVKHKKEVKEAPKKVVVGSLDNFFPKKGSGVTSEKDEYWGFFKNKTSGQQLQNICGASDCDPTKTEPYGRSLDPVTIELFWTKGGESNPELKSWSSDLN